MKIGLYFYIKNTEKQTSETDDSQNYRTHPNYSDSFESISRKRDRVFRIVSTAAKLYWKLNTRDTRYGLLKIYDAQCRQYHFLRFNMRPLNRCPSLTYVA